MAIYNFCSDSIVSLLLRIADLKEIVVDLFALATKLICIRWICLVRKCISSFLLFVILDVRHRFSKAIAEESACV